MSAFLFSTTVMQAGLTGNVEPRGLPVFHSSLSFKRNQNPSLLFFLERKNIKLCLISADVIVSVFIFISVTGVKGWESRSCGRCAGLQWHVPFGSSAILMDKKNLVISVSMWSLKIKAMLQKMDLMKFLQMKSARGPL